MKSHSNFIKISLFFSFFLDIKVFPVFDIISVLQVQNVIFCFFALVGLDLLFFNMGFTIVSYFQIEQDRMRKLDSNSSRDAIKKLVEDQNKLYKCSEIFTEIFAAPMFCMYGSAVANIVLVGFYMIAVSFWNGSD